jgi:repressor LexA
MKYEKTAKRLMKALSDNNMRAQDLVNATGISKASISQYVNGSHAPSNISAGKMAAALGVSPIWLMGFDVSPTSEDPTAPIHPDIKDIKIYRTPMLGDVACGQPIVANPEYETYIETDFNPKANRCVRARGDSMIGARIYDGDIVFIKDCDTVDNGDIAVVIIEDEVTLKRFYYYPDQNIVQLIAENPAYAPLIYSGEEINHIKIVGKALFFQGVIK